MTILRILALLVPALSVAAQAQQNPAGLVLPGTAVVRDALSPLPAGAVQLSGGLLGSRFNASERNRLRVVNEDELLDAFEHRDATHQVWQGEHAGKFLHAACITWKTTGDAQLKAKTQRVASRLMATQEPDGYLGTYPSEMRWTAWDVWVHKYDLLGLLTYYQYMRDPAALAACRKIGDLLVATFGPGLRDINKSGEHMGMAPDSVIEPMVLLYRATGDARYLTFAKYIVANYDAPGGPRILDSLEKTGSVRKVANGKAYEMLSNLNGLLELYRVTGEKRLLKAVLIAWKDIVAHRLYLTGSASSGEHFQDDFVLPHGESSNICETCVTVTWQQMNMNLLCLTGEARFAGELERTVYNHLLGAQTSNGDQWCYYTPLEGRKPYGKSTSCCLSSGPRGVSLLPSAMMMTARDGGINLNLYNNAKLTANVKGTSVTLTETTDYPNTGRITVEVSPSRAVSFPLRLRIPAWSTGALLFVNGRPAKIARKQDGYAVVDRVWRKGDSVRLDIPIAPRIVPGDHGNAGKAAVAYGPLVLAMESTFNPWAKSLRQASFSKYPGAKVERVSKPGQPIRFKTNGLYSTDNVARTMVLTPYNVAGQGAGSRLQVWIALPGHADRPRPGGSLFFGGDVTVSRRGNQEGDIADDDTTTFRVTWDTTKAAEDWYAVSLPAPVAINRVVFVQGRYYHDGGWFNTAASKPRVEVKTSTTAGWTPAGTLDSYPATTDTDPAGLKEAQSFEVRFPTLKALAIRVVGTPGSGDGPTQNFSSCAELQGFLAP